MHSGWLSHFMTGCANTLQDIPANQSETGCLTDRRQAGSGRLRKNKCTDTHTEWNKLVNIILCTKLVNYSYFLHSRDVFFYYLGVLDSFLCCILHTVKCSNHPWTIQSDMNNRRIRAAWLRLLLLKTGRKRMELANPAETGSHTAQWCQHVGKVWGPENTSKHPNLSADQRYVS